MEIGLRMSRYLLAIFMLFAVAATPQANAADNHDTLGKGPPVGEKIPH
jgi:hypothetical protein